ncbi:MAG: adenylate kinase [Bacteroidetes bacterium OLB9]|nr:MAG: adenylate kinase [Bacteroidetes bacterium OLB9]
MWSFLETLNSNMLNLILFGPPGSGKGTQAENLINKYGILHISTGDLFRYEMGNNTPLGQKAKEYMAKGELVPDEVTIGMLKNKVEANPGVNGIIFDGFPRTIAQAEALDAYLAEKGTEVTALLALEVPEEELIRRLLMRGTTSGRADDQNEEIICNRINVYNTETAPVFDYYESAGKTKRIQGVGTVEEIFDKLVAVLDEVYC